MAVWSSSTDYSNKTAIGFTILLIGTLLNPCLCAPTTSTTTTTTTTDSQTTEPWWYNPCDNLAGRLRHSRSADHYQIVNRSLKQFVKHLSVNVKDINKLYKVTKTGKEHPNKSWLKIKKMLKRIKTNPDNRLYEFHETLQYFAGAHQLLSDINISTFATDFDNTKRKQIYQNNIWRLKSLLCQVELTLLDNDKDIPPGIPLDKMNIPTVKILDQTGAKIWDLAFFKKMKSFFIGVNRIFRNKDKRSRKFNEKKNNNNNNSAVVKKSNKRTMPTN